MSAGSLGPSIRTSARSCSWSMASVFARCASGPEPGVAPGTATTSASRRSSSMTGGSTCALVATSEPSPTTNPVPREGEGGAARFLVGAHRYDGALDALNHVDGVCSCRTRLHRAETSSGRPAATCHLERCSSAVQSRLRELESIAVDVRGQGRSASSITLPVPLRA